MIISGGLMQGQQGQGPGLPLDSGPPLMDVSNFLRNFRSSHTKYRRTESTYTYLLLMGGHLIKSYIYRRSAL
jgi:hypothetical protein